MATQVVIDLRDPKQREELLMAELEQANIAMMEGEWTGGVGLSRGSSSPLTSR